VDRAPRPWPELALYGGSAAIALLVARHDAIPLMRDWARFAFWPYALGAIAVAALLLLRGWSVAGRAAVAAAVIAGAAVLPTAGNVIARDGEGRRTHAQSELLIVEESARALARGANPYAVSFDSGPLATWPPGTRSHVAYLPGSFVFGLPGVVADGWAGDARVWLGLVGAGALALALRRSRAGASRAALACVVLLGLPFGARAIAGGGADVTILAIVLLSLVLARDRRPVAAGLALGAAAAMKQIAWPLLPFLLLAARDRAGRPAWGRMAVAAGAVAVPVVVPFAAWDPGAFVEDVVRFPLGLAGPTPAGEATVGAWLSTALGLPRLWVAVGMGVVVAGAGTAFLLLRPVRTAGAAAERAGLLILLATVLATAGRPGYLVYPLNLLVWSRLLLREGSGEAELSSRRERGEAVADVDLGGQAGIDPGPWIRPPGADRRPPLRRRRLPAPLR
jgi:hypothetical protein